MNDFLRAIAYLLASLVILALEIIFLAYFARQVFGPQEARAFIVAVLKVFVVLYVVAAISIFGTQLFGAPWVPMPQKAVRKMLTLADVGPDDLVYDLGCGDGRVLVTAASHFGARAVGIEIDPFRYVWCRALITVRGLRGQVRVLWGNFFRHDLGQADVVTCFLRQPTNQRLMDKLASDLRPGTRVISYKNTFTGWELARQDEVEKLYLYIIQPSFREATKANNSTGFSTGNGPET